MRKSWDAPGRPEAGEVRQAVWTGGKLLTFVESVESDAFWRSEVVQIVARTTPAGALEIDLVPRSGRHTVRFGRLEDAERKFDKLMRFYRGGLSRIGWEEFRTIDLRYNDQVVCRK